MSIESAIRAIPDYPKPGIIFRDITPLLKDSQLLSKAVEAMLEPFRDTPIDYIAGMEARGFIFGTLAAQQRHVGFVPLRKPGKLPFDVHRVDYTLEYGSAGLELHTDALGQSDRVLVIDDLLATGGTAAASCDLITTTNAQVVGCAFLIELTGLSGRAQLESYPVHSVIQYDG